MWCAVPRNCLVNITDKGLELAVLADADTITIDENSDDGDHEHVDDDPPQVDVGSKRKPNQRVWIPPEIRFQDMQPKTIAHKTFEGGYCGKIHCI